MTGSHGTISSSRRSLRDTLISILEEDAYTPTSSYGSTRPLLRRVENNASPSMYDCAVTSPMHCDLIASDSDLVHLWRSHFAWEHHLPNR